MSTLSSTLTRPQNVANSHPGSNVSPLLTKAVYQTDQQVKFLHLQVEVEILLQQLQSLKKQRLTLDCQDAAFSDAIGNKKL
jgi:hypothetical protein